MQCFLRFFLHSSCLNRPLNCDKTCLFAVQSRLFFISSTDVLCLTDRSVNFFFVGFSAENEPFPSSMEKEIVLLSFFTFSQFIRCDQISCVRRSILHTRSPLYFLSERNPIQSKQFLSVNLSLAFFLPVMQCIQYIPYLLLRLSF